jgi:hypothetical protein
MINDDIRTLAKWLNEEQLCEIDRPTLARVLTFAQSNIKNYPEKDIEAFSGQTWNTEYEALQAGIEFYGMIDLEVGANSASEFYVYPKDCS